MGQEIRGISQDPPLTATAPEASDPEPSIGRYLAGQRRLRGVSLDDLAELTKIPRRSLERLEDGAFDQQADGFARGFVRTVADALGLDAEEAVLRLLGEPPGGDPDLAFSRLMLRRWAVAGGVLTGCMAVFYGLWLLWSSVPETSSDRAPGDIVYRRDAVRSLAKAERAIAETSEPLDSAREGLSD